MSLRYWYRDNDGTITEFTSRVNIAPDDGEPFVGEAVAEQGAVGQMTITVNDPEGTFLVRGHRKVYITSTLVTGTNKTIWVGYTGRRVTKRMDPWSGPARRIVMDVYDLNAVLERRLGVGADWKRPAETDVERMTWVMATNEAALVEDSIYISSADPVNMSASDYRGQSWKAVIDDCSQQSGKNFYVTNIDSGNSNTGDFNDYTLWYGHDSLAVYTSAIRLTNDEADLDADTWMVYTDIEHERIPDRVHSGVVGNYDNGSVYVRRQSTATAFASIDRAVSMTNVKTAAAARARANRELTDHATEEDVITCTVKVAEARANDLREGMRVEAKFLHLDDFADDYVWCRVLRRTFTQKPPGNMEIKYVLAGPSLVTPGTAATGILRQSKGPFSGRVYWNFPGDTPDPGYPVQVTGAMVEVLTDGTPPNADWPHYGWKILGTGTVDVTFFATTAGVLIEDIDFTVTYSILLNGVAVASDVTVVSGNLVFHADEKTVSIAGLAVVPDDEITATITVSPTTMPNFLTPLGAGQQGERLEITGGTLV